MDGTHFRDSDDEEASHLPPVHNELRGGTFFGPVVQAGSIGSVTFAGPAGAAMVPLDAAIRDPAPVFASVLSRGFTGREWLIGQVDDFLRQQRCGYVWIEADAGMGKSALAAHLVRERGWFGHFARYTKGGTARVALRNLAGQLITRYGMWELAPGRMLPAPPFVPEWFETVLAAAAERARTDGGRVVLVVDGADEAERPSGLLPWGLPSLLPDGVFVVGTYRTGRPPGHSEAPRRVVRIEAADPRNQQDVISHLGVEVRGDVLAARLVDVGLSADQFTQLVAIRCGGVWVYLRYVLDEIRLNLRKAGDVDDLPVDLSSYYTSHLEAWSRDEHGEHGALPLLATLAAVGEPLPTATLALLAGMSEGGTRGWCEYQLRPFLRSTTGPERSFEIYHASLRELFTGGAVGSGDGGPGAGRQPDDLVAWSDTLTRATVAAHDRVAEHYLSTFGGLDVGLPALAADPALAAGMDDGYPLRHLARHLHRSRRIADLHQLLRAEWSMGQGRAVNVWFAAHDHADTLDGYLDDVVLAREDSERRTDRALREHRPATALAEEVHYTLIVSSLTSLTDNVPADLLSHLVVHGIWTARRALVHARRLTDPEARARALASLAPLLPAERQQGVLAEAVEAAESIISQHSRPQVLTELVEAMPTGRRMAVVSRAQQAVSAITHDGERARGLARLVRHVPGQSQRDMVILAMGAATASRDRSRRAGALTAMAGDLPTRWQRSVLEVALRESADGVDRRFHAQASVALVAFVPAAFRRAAAEQALEEVVAIDGVPDRVRAMAQLAAHLPGEMHRAVIEQALELANALGDDRARARELAALVGKLPAERQQAVAEQAWEAATAIVLGYERAEALVELVRLLPSAIQQSMAERAVESAAVLTDWKSRAKVLTGLLGHVPRKRRRATAELALSDVTSIGQDYLRARALAGLAGHVPTDRLAAVAERLLAAAAGEYVEVLVKLVRQLPAAMQQSVAERAVEYVAAREAPAQVKALTGLAAHLSEERRRAVIEQALELATAALTGKARAWALTTVIGHLPAHRRQTVVEQALEDIDALSDAHERAGMLAGLLAQLPTEQRHPLAERALSAVTDEPIRALHIVLPEVYYRAFGLRTAAAELRTAAERAKGTTLRFSTCRIRARAVSGLIEHLPEGRRQAVLAQALKETALIDWADHRAWALTQLALRLPAEQCQNVLEQALTAAAASPFRAHRALALAKVVEHLPAERQGSVVEQVLSEATAGTDRVGDTRYRDRDRVRALAKVIGHLPAEERRDVAAQALRIATTIPDDEYFRSEVLAELAPHLPAALQARAQAINLHRKVAALTAWLARPNELVLADHPSDEVTLLREATRSISRGDYLAVLRDVGARGGRGARPRKGAAGGAGEVGLDPRGGVGGWGAQGC
ncbi:hypothetical protein ACFWJY_15620, partial [Streptomyces anulatus]|uniref:hypothetical protein n=1 Tax=Streptomyces anulatus TaxID=1892 RepID=UPI00366278A5